MSVYEIDAAGKATADLMLQCRRCGAHGDYSTDHLAAMELEWTRDQKIVLVERYWSGRPLTCPNDGSILTVIESDEVTSGPTEFSVRCKRCGRYFWSSDVEGKPAPDSFKGKYEFIRELGKGGMGYVSLVRERKGAGHFAAKQILPEFLRDPELIRRFQREERILRSLSHPCIVRFYEFFLDEEGAVLVIDYMSKGDLCSAINNKAVPGERLADYIDNTAEGLSYLHSKGIVHRDLKPTNILIGDDGAKISDFGLATLIARDSTPLTQAGVPLGTFHYAAPEQLVDAGNVSVVADVYALALTAYEVATRTSPQFRVVFSGLHSELEAALSIALQADPLQRKVSAREIAVALRKHLTEAR